MSFLETIWNMPSMQSLWAICMKQVGLSSPYYWPFKNFQVRVFQVLIVMIVIPFSGANRKVINFGIKFNLFANWGAKPYRLNGHPCWAPHPIYFFNLPTFGQLHARIVKGFNFQSSSFHSIGKSYFLSKLTSPNTTQPTIATC